MSGWDDADTSGGWDEGAANNVKDSTAFDNAEFAHANGDDAGLDDCFGDPQDHGPAKMTGECYNCGQVGHNKADCPNPKIDRPFTGACRHCEQEGHRAAECPNKPPETCRNCGEEGHKLADCEAPRKRDLSNIPDMNEDEAMQLLAKASAQKDTELFKEGVMILVKGNPELTYVTIEQKLRAAKLSLYLVGKLRNTPKNMTNVDLQGRQDCKFSIGYCLSPKPVRLFNKNEFPRTAEENLERLNDAGDTLPSFVPVCRRCDQKGHTTKGCNQPPPEEEKRLPQCFNCGETGHYWRDCGQARVDKSACRNCGGSGHRAADCTEPRSAAHVKCRKCSEMGHFSRDCPTEGGDGGGSRACRNCGEEGHIAKDCDKPRDPSTITCRNCDETGHVSRECPKPRDYSRVKCNNCGQMGHTQVRCKAAPADGGFENDAAEAGLDDAVVGGGFDRPPAVGSNGSSWDKATAGDESGW